MSDTMTKFTPEKMWIVADALMGDDKDLIAAMLRQGADAESRWEQLKAEVGKTAADYAADIEINTYRSGQKAHAKAALAEMARLEKERTA